MFHETLHAAIEASLASLEQAGAVFDHQDAVAPFVHGGIPYPQAGADSLPSVSSNFMLESLKGKSTRKGGHVTIWRHESGRYEENSYIL